MSKYSLQTNLNGNIEELSFQFIILSLNYFASLQYGQRKAVNLFGVADSSHTVNRASILTRNNLSVRIV